MYKNRKANCILLMLVTSIILPVLFLSCELFSGSASYSDIVINEVQSKNDDATLKSDFVELYNLSTKDYTFSEGEWSLTDSGGVEEHVFYIPDGTIIEGNGFLLLLTDVTDINDVEGTAPDGCLYCEDDGINIAFGLGSEDGIYLYYTGSDNSSPESAVDSTTWDDHVATRARIPDGGDWADSDTNTQTPGESND